MRVDCYNASECPISSIEFGDTFYYNSELYIKINPSTFIPNNQYYSWAVALSDGRLTQFDEGTSVILADTKVIANTKVAF